MAASRTIFPVPFSVRCKSALSVLQLEIDFVGQPNKMLSNLNRSFSIIADKSRTPSYPLWTTQSQYSSLCLITSKSTAVLSHSEDILLYDLQNIQICTKSAFAESIELSSMVLVNATLHEKSLFTSQNILHSKRCDIVASISVATKLHSPVFVSWISATGCTSSPLGTILCLSESLDWIKKPLGNDK